MLKQSIKLYTTVNNLQNFLKYPTYCTQLKRNLKWDLLSAICIERHPIISVPKAELEDAFQKMLDEVEVESSMKCDHEMRIEAETEVDEKIKKGLITEVDPDKVTVERAQDIEDHGEKELEAYKFASTITESDEKDIKTSLQRKLDKVLLLVMQQKIGKDIFWLPPQGIREEGENMRQTAERVLKNTCGEQLNIKIYGNAPVGVYKYAYPRPMRVKGNYGAKIFYYLGKYVDGDISNDAKYQWLDRQELAVSLPHPICKRVSMFLIPDQSASQ